MTPAQGLYEAVRPLSKAARSKIVRTWLLVCSDADADAWRTLVDSEKHRRARSERDRIPPASEVSSGTESRHTSNDCPATLAVEPAGQGEASKEESGFSLDSLPKGETPGKKEKPLRGKKKETAPCPPDPRHKPFIDGYTTAYHAVFNRPYVFDGGKDGTGVKRLLKSASPDHYSAELLAAIAKAAMLKSKDQFARVTKFSQTIWQFCQNFNAISAEVGSVSATPAVTLEPVSHLVLEARQREWEANIRQRRQREDAA